MANRLSPARRLWTAALWPVGIALTSWNYMWRTTPMHRSEERGGQEDLPPRLPDVAGGADVQRLEDGVGPLFRRLYRARIRDAGLSPEELIGRLGSDPNAAAPTELARFIKVRGAEGRLAVGDEIVVRMPGPWDGPVRVTTSTPTSFGFATLSGHLEAGQIEFRATRDDGLLQFEIESAGQRDFEVWKWLDTGEVEFRTHAVSRPADANVVVRLGFRLLGRHKQVEFGRRACRRMALLSARPHASPQTDAGA